jgi:pimeloyl-ACP methyl ester carboxylesterase
MPILLIYGDSTIWFESHIAARFGELRPDAAQIVIEGATHNSHVERPDVVGPKIAAFLSAP